MAKIPIVTSIPEEISRLNLEGQEIGYRYQRECIASWQDAGFEPISANSRNESCAHPVDVIPVSRDASAVTGRPHVYLSDLLAIASAKAPGEAFALVNADVSLALNTDLSTKVMALQPGAFIFSRRLDIAYPGQVEGTPWHHGYDFFAGHTDDLAGLADAGLVFGAPWWDHFFPLLMHMQGCRIRQIEPAVVHLSHTERWSWSVWEALGQRFIAGIEACSTDETYRSRLDDALKGRSGRLLPDLRRNISMRLPKYAAGEAPRLLHRISELNVSFLDRVSLETV